MKLAASGFFESFVIIGVQKSLSNGIDLEYHIIMKSDKDSKMKKSRQIQVYLQSNQAVTFEGIRLCAIETVDVSVLSYEC